MFDKTDMHCVYMMYILYTLYLHCLYQTTATKSPRYQDNLVPDNNEVKFDAVDLYVPEQCWRENEVEDDLVCILYVILFSLSFTFYPMCLCLELRNFVHSCQLVTDNRRVIIIIILSYQYFMTIHILGIFCLTDMSGFSSENTCFFDF